MKSHLIIHQTKMETDALQAVTGALELAAAWQVDGDDFSLKLSSVRFAAETFQRHLERLFALEELDGYLEVVSDLNPTLGGKIAELQRQHEKLRAMVRQLVLRLETAPRADRQEMAEICRRVAEVVQLVREHSQRESMLLIDAMLSNTGGEG